MSSVNTPQLRRLWGDAQVRPEWATTKFWEYVFNHNAFTSHRWAVASQQPPTDGEGDNRRVDLVVERIDDDANITTLLFMEAKRANATRDQVEAVEYQAFTACCANLYTTQRPAIWAMTCVGSMARLWAYQYNSDYLTPYFPLGDSLSEMGEYAEFSVSSREILKVLEFIKHNIVPPNEIFERPPSPRPTNATLPSGWHDQEVALVAAPPESHVGVEAGEAPFAGSAQSYDAATASHHVPREEPIAQGASLDPETCTQVTVKKHALREGRSCYYCALPDGTRINTYADGWTACTVLFAGAPYPAYTYKGSSGRQYYTWTFEMKGKEAKK